MSSHVTELATRYHIVVIIAAAAADGEICLGRVKVPWKAALPANETKYRAITGEPIIREIGGHTPVNGSTAPEAKAGGGNIKR